VRVRILRAHIRGPDTRADATEDVP
jgi:hypothetical protein